MAMTTRERKPWAAGAMLALIFSSSVAAGADTGSGAAAVPAKAAEAKGKALTGAAARASEPGKAVVALLTAARKGDRAAVRKLLLPEVVKDLDASPEMVMEVLKDIGDETISEITIEIVDADMAKGRVGKQRSPSLHESTGMTLKRVDGTWKVSL